MKDLLLFINLILPKNLPIYEINLRMNNKNQFIILFRLLEIKNINLIKDYLYPINDIIGCYYQLWEKEKVVKKYHNDYHILFEKDNLIEIVNDFKFIIKPNIFFQVNPYVYPIIYQKLIDIIKNLDIDILYDLCCGCGIIGIINSKNVNKVKGYEINPNNIKVLEENLKLNNINNYEYYLGDINKTFNDTIKENDLVIINPSRGGLNEKIRNKLKMINRMIYLSCCKKTAKRDIKEMNFKYEKIKFNQFPNTGHEEILYILYK
jgi:23S rRNA (uracil1939-C5)-methyltransferase